MYCHVIVTPCAFKSTPSSSPLSPLILALHCPTWHPCLPHARLSLNHCPNWYDLVNYICDNDRNWGAGQPREDLCSGRSARCVMTTSHLLSIDTILSTAVCCNSVHSTHTRYLHPPTIRDGGSNNSSMSWLMIAAPFSVQCYHAVVTMDDTTSVSMALGCGKTMPMKVKIGDDGDASSPSHVSLVSCIFSVSHWHVLPSSAGIPLPPVAAMWHALAQPYRSLLPTMHAVCHTHTNTCFKTNRKDNG